MATLNGLRNLTFLGLILTLAFWLPGTVAAQDEGPQVRITQVDTSQFPQVTVYISVTNADGAPVGVDPNRIQIYENGQLVQSEQISGSGEIGPLTTLLVIDVSGSMNNADKLEGARAAAQAYVAQMRPGDQAGLIAFNTQVTYVQPITSDRQALSSAIQALRAEKDTAMYDALGQAVQILADVPGRKAIIVLTDGLDNVSKTNVDEVIQSIGPSGLSISTIGLGDPDKLGINSGLNEEALKSLAERAGGVYGYANDPDALRTLYERYGRALQSEYQITYTSPSTLRDGLNRMLTVSLADPTGASVSAQAQYNPGGVLPETARRASWHLFGGLLGGLLVLLIVPGLISHGVRALGGSKRRGRVKLSKPAKRKEPRVRLK